MSMVRAVSINATMSMRSSEVSGSRSARCLMCSNSLQTLVTKPKIKITIATMEHFPNMTLDTLRCATILPFKFINQSNHIQSQ